MRWIISLKLVSQQPILAKEGYDEAYGARPGSNSNLYWRWADEILNEKVKEGETISVEITNKTSQSYHRQLSLSR
jgi:ATP-dependent Clp protease ATP-binding subunit ClpA